MQPQTIQPASGGPAPARRPGTPVSDEYVRMGAADVRSVEARGILTRTSGFIASYDWTLNPYSGCGFGCTYCYAASFSGGQILKDRWGEWVRAKSNAAELLRRDRDMARSARIYMSTVTDPYQPAERKLGIVRALLEEMADPEDPVRPRLVVQTRSPDAVRDVDLFRRIEEQGGRVQVNMTVTTDDEDVRKAFEPTCPGNEARLEAIAEIQSAGVQSCITMTPLLPVRDADGFADRLLETGVKRFIVQPFHWKEGDFVAGTRDEALRTAAGLLGCAPDEVQGSYTDRYREIRETLARRLPGLGEGKDGFAPPF